ncbi:MAG: hypothetical protein DDT32_02224 [Syntrophomonadaceae bacterium]|nr:hypothetical protein [Bacillota bacterium]MBT9148450.1 hypothetical protein [Bacillota bacterium]
MMDKAEFVESVTEKSELVESVGFTISWMAKRCPLPK